MIKYPSLEFSHGRCHMEVGHSSIHTKQSSLKIKYPMEFDLISNTFLGDNPYAVRLLANGPSKNSNHMDDKPALPPTNGYGDATKSNRKNC